MRTDTKIEDNEAIDMIRAIAASSFSRVSDYHKLCLIYSILEQTGIDSTHIFGHYSDGRPCNQFLIKTMYGKKVITIDDWK